MTLLRRSAAAVCALSLGVALATGPAFADNIDLGSDSTGAITGIAWDAQSEEVLITDESGSLTARGITGEERPVPFAGTPDSVQALALFDSMIYIGDVGDADATREFVTVLQVNPATEATNFRAWDFTYPDGPRDAKAMAISGKGRIYVITGGDDPGIYRAALTPSRSEMNTLVRSTDAPPGVTDAVFLEDGSTLMLRTADGVELLDAFTWEEKASTTYVDGPPGESITTFGPDRMLVGGVSLLRDEALPDGRTTVTPAPSAEPTSPVSAEPTPSPEATASTTPNAPVTSDVSRNGTLMALLGAALVAVVAGVVVFVARD
ncbi:hypothetical protein [Tessaracoccus sp.]